MIGSIQLAKLWGHIPVKWQQRLQLPVMAAAIVLAMLMVWNSVEFKDNLLRNPLMSVEERRATALAERQPDLYERLYGDGR